MSTPEAVGVTRYLMISSMGADTDARDDSGDPVFAAYLRAKAAADDNVWSRAGLSSTSFGQVCSPMSRGPAG